MDQGDAANANASRRLASILLARNPRFTDSRNETTATAESKVGFTMAVSFWMADPPQLSIFSIDCSKPHDMQHEKHSDFSALPHVVGLGADGRFVLLRAAFAARFGGHEYFLYKAGDAGESPSLERIPSPFEYDDGGDCDDLRGVREFGIVVLRGHGGHYLVAALCLARDAPSDDYQLRIYSSETKLWSTRTLHNPCPGVDRIIPDKVITLGEEGLLGWVDLSHGLLVCDVLRQDQDPPDVSVSFIPLPEPLPGNRYKLKCPPIVPGGKRKKKLEESHRSGDSASCFRDLACVDGVLKFIEMENPAPEKLRSGKEDIIYDSDLIMSLERKAMDWNSKQPSFRDAWRAVTWSRTVSSSNCWRQTCAADVADILVDGSVHSSLLKGETVTLLTFRDLYSAFPILSPDGDDILYLKSLVEPSNRDGWVAAVDLGNKAVKAIGKYYLPDDFYYSRGPGHDPGHPFRACTLSCHLDMTPGIEVSACRKITQASSSANHPSNTSIRVGELNSCEPRSNIQRALELAEKIKRARNAAGSIIQNDHISQQLDDKVLELERERKQKKEQKPQQQCFNKWDAPCYPPGHSLWPHQNNLPPLQCFNKPDGPCGPGYASLAPVHGRHNYQPLWQQPPPSKQQLTSSSEFGPHEAPQPCFNNCNGASYHGYSQQLSAPNSFAYGAHTGYGNYQQQWQQLPPTLELPIGASWQHPPPPVQRQPTPRE